MAVSWDEAVDEQLNDPDSASISDATIAVWKRVGEKVNLLEQCPEPNPNVIFRELHDRNYPYYVLKNTEAKTYMRLSEEEFGVWSQMDGQTTVQELIVNHFMEAGDFSHSTIVNLVYQLHIHHMLAEAPIAAWSAAAMATQRRTLAYRISAPAQAFMSRPLAIPGVDRFVTAIYDHGGWLFFTRPAKIIMALIAVLGFGAFLAIVLGDQYRMMGSNLIASLVVIWAAAILPVVIHELGHALTVKHYGREVPRAGVMLFFGLPAAFVETTDIWLEPRSARLAVTWNGPYTGMIIGGLAAIFMLLFPAAGINSFLYKMAGFAYLTVLLNANPLLKFDGYYLLADALDMPALRERSIAFVRRDLANHIVQRQKLRREEWLYATYGVLTILWMFVAIWMALTFWQSRVQQGVEAMIGPDTPLGPRLLGFLLVAGMVSLVVLLTLALARFGRQLVTRYIASGGLVRHRQMALIAAAIAVALSVGIPLLFPAYARMLSSILGLVVALLAAVQLALFGRKFLPARRGLSYISLAGSVTLYGLANLLLASNQAAQFRSIMSLIAAVLFIVGGFLLVRMPRSASGRRGFLIGLIAAIGVWLLLFFGFGLSVGDLGLWIVPGLVLAGIWSITEVRGGARPPALALLLSGSLVFAVSLVFQSDIPDLSLLGTLLASAGAFHIVYAQLPQLSSYDRTALTVAQQAIGASMAVVVKRIVAQVFFESGTAGVDRLNMAYLDVMEQHGLKLAIMGNQFVDQELGTRPVGEMAEVYGLALDELHGVVRQELGSEQGRQAFGHGVDLIPWENREAFTEMVLGRRTWSQAGDWEDTDFVQQRRKLLRRVPLLETLSDDELDEVARHLRTQPYDAGETIIRQGESGDTFFIVDSGMIEIWRTGEDGVEQRVDNKGPGQFFGEAALVSNQPRNASAVAITPGLLLVLGKTDFDSLVAHHISLGENVNYGVKYGWLLRAMPLFDELDSRQLRWLGEQVEVETMVADEVVFHEGDAGDKFYIVQNGRLVITREVEGKPILVSTLGPGEYVGEIALLENTPRTATVTTVMPTTLLSLKAEYFADLINGHIEIGESLNMAGSRRLRLADRISSPALKGTQA